MIVWLPGPTGSQGEKGDGGGIPGDQGPPGLAGVSQNVAGAPGPTGARGIDCFDDNGNGVGDPAEDVNGDGQYDYLDCQGIRGVPGPQGPQGWGSYLSRPSKLALEMLSVPPTFEAQGIYLDDGTNRASGLPGFRYWKDGGWVD